MVARSTRPTSDRAREPSLPSTPPPTPPERLSQSAPPLGRLQPRRTERPSMRRTVVRTPYRPSTRAPTPPVIRSTRGPPPNGVGVSPDGTTVYVTNINSDDVTPIDTATNTAGTPINVGNRPIGVVFM